MELVAIYFIPGAWIVGREEVSMPEGLAVHKVCTYYIFSSKFSD